MAHHVSSLAYCDDDEQREHIEAQIQECLDAAGDKLDAYGHVIARMVLEQQHAQAEIDRAAERKSRVGKEIGRLRARALGLAIARERATGDSSWDGGKVRIRRRKSSRVEVHADPATLPEAFQRVTIAPDKTTIKAYLKANPALCDINGEVLAELVEHTSESVEWR
jgi:hypothetical protein